MVRLRVGGPPSSSLHCQQLAPRQQPLTWTSRSVVNETKRRQTFVWPLGMFVFFVPFLLGLCVGNFISTASGWTDASNQLGQAAVRMKRPNDGLPSFGP
jgi:hypothetical protein